METIPDSVQEPVDIVMQAEDESEIIELDNVPLIVYLPLGISLDHVIYLCV